MFGWLTRMVRMSFVEGVRQGMADISPDVAPQTLEEFGKLIAAPAPALPAKADDADPEVTEQLAKPTRAKK